MSFEKMSGRGAVFDAGAIVRRLPTPFCSAGLEEWADGPVTGQLEENSRQMKPTCRFHKRPYLQIRHGNLARIRTSHPVEG